MHLKRSKTEVDWIETNTTKRGIREPLKICGWLNFRTLDLSRVILQVKKKKHSRRLLVCLENRKNENEFKTAVKLIFFHDKEKKTWTKFNNENKETKPDNEKVSLTL